MKKTFTKFLAALMLLAIFTPSFTAMGQTRELVTDELTASSFTATNTTYSDFSNVTATSDAVYAGNSAKSSSGGIQLRSKYSNSGIVTTTSGGTIHSVKVTVESGTNTLDIYGKHTAYSAASDLYGNNAGTKIGSISSTGTVNLGDNADQYEYIGLRSNNGALYLTKIEIVYTTGGGSSYTITPASNNNNWGTVTLSGTTITASPTTGYRVSTTNPYEVTSGTATVTQNGNSFSVTASSNCTVQINFEAIPTYTVTYNCNGGTSGCPSDLTGVEDGTIITLEDGPTKDNYDFDGWSDGTDIYDAGDEYTVNGNVTFTAQWTEHVEVHWVLTDLANLTTSDVFVIVSTKASANYAMSNNNGTSSAPSAVSVTVSDAEITSTIEATIQWNISGDATNGYKFYPNGSTETWLYCTDQNNGVRVGTTNTNNYDKFEIKDNYIYNKGRSAYLGVYNNADWRRYSTINNNISGQTFAFYKKVTGSVIPPSITANNVNIGFNATSGEISYTLNNPATNGSLSVSENVDWISYPILNTTESKVTFTTTVNEVTSAREGIITLTYTYGDNETVSKDVTITQAAAPVTYSTIPALYEAATTTSTSVTVNLGGWIVTGVNGNQLFVTDGTNGFIMYQKDHGFIVNNTLSGTVECNLVLFNSSTEITGITSTTTGLTVGTGTVTPRETTIGSLGAVNTGSVVTLANLTYNGTTLSDGTNSITPYNSLFAGTYENGKKYNVTGVFVLNNTEKRILARNAADIVEVQDPYINASNVDITCDATNGNISYTIENEPSPAGTLTATVVAGYTISNLSIGTPSNGSIAFTCDANNTTTARTATITLAYTYGSKAQVTATITITQAAYVPTPGDYVRVINAVKLTDGCKVIIAARYDDLDNTKYYAMPGTASGKPTGVAFSSITSNSKEILPASIANNDETYYWTVNVTKDGENTYYTFTNKNNQTIGWTSGTNFVTGGNTGWTISRETASSTAMVANYTGFVIRNANTNTRAFAFNGTAFGAYSTTNNAMDEPGYNFYLDFFVQESTFTLPIEHWTVEQGTSGNPSDGWYLIASPVAYTLAEQDMVSGTGYDLYRFNPTASGAEWENYKALDGNNQPLHTNFTTLEVGRGYLYANATNIILSFTGLPSYNSEVNMPYAGWNLIGNPLGTAATLDKDFYQMNSTHTGIMPDAGSSVAFMEGVFVFASEANEKATFTQGGGSKSRNNNALVINLNNNDNVIDRAIVRFNDDRQLGKLTLFDGDTKIYIPQNDGDYAIVSSNGEGSMPVNFKAKEMGRYTISVETEGIDMSYLHLIDRLTGEDVNLLLDNEYSFIASNNDSEERFILSFTEKGYDAHGNEIFVYQSGNDLIVNGEGELQIFDVMGRNIMNTTINGVQTVNVKSQGVYIFKLNEKTQKIIVR